MMVFIYFSYFKYLEQLDGRFQMLKSNTFNQLFKIELI